MGYFTDEAEVRRYEAARKREQERCAARGHGKILPQTITYYGDDGAERTERTAFCRDCGASVEPTHAD